MQRVGNSEAKHVDTFYANDSRQSHQAPHKKDFGFCQGLFYLRDEGENPFEGSSEERAECGMLLQRVGNSEAKHVDTFNSSDSRQSYQAPLLFYII